MHITNNENTNCPGHFENEAACPKCGHTRHSDLECTKCGIIFSKYHAHKTARSSEVNNPEPLETNDPIDLWTNRAGRLSLIVLMLFFFFYMIVKKSSWCFLDHVNLPFHEAGHILFAPFGDTVQFLGGTISQLMWPLILFSYFIARKECLSSTFCLFWFGENFLNISKYIADARSMVLPLVGGGIHDWNYLLGKWNLLHHDHTIANILFAVGSIIMTSAIVWAFFAKNHKELQKDIL